MQYLILVCAALVAACGVLFQLWSNADDRADREGDRADRAENALQTVKENEHVVTKYLDRVVTVERTRPVVGAALQRLCESAGLHSSGQPDGPAAPTPDAGSALAGLADDVVACRANAAQLQALQDVIRPQL